MAGAIEEGDAPGNDVQAPRGEAMQCHVPAPVERELEVIIS